MKKAFTSSDVTRIAVLAHIPLREDEKVTLAAGFTTTMEVVEALQKVDITNIEPTHQVTGMQNIFREDIVDTARMFTQEQAVANALHTDEGYFVVEQILDQDIG